MVTAQSRWWYERSRLKRMDWLRNHEAVKVGDLDKNMESKKVLTPKFTTDFPEAVVREGEDDEQMKKGHCEPSSTTRMWETKDGGHRSWMRTGTPSARPFPSV